MPTADQIKQYYQGYQSWNDAASIVADYMATGGQGKGNTPYALGGGQGGDSGIPTFDFDFVKAAEEAYGELGPYYLRILNESKGDMNLALSRLTEDYDRGKRIRKEDLGTKQEDLQKRRLNSLENMKTQQLEKGISQTSTYDPSGGMGIATEQLRKTEEPYDTAGEDLLTAFERSGESSDITKSRGEFDLKESQKRREFDLEQQRRKEAATLAESRGERAYRSFTAGLT